ncbi:uncharacterized protein LOC122391203 isoform X7 [Amphibalanus amphitrite]|uniref:uncharacterized protein LOC122391203 isoform X7 n=1 Tax=Amphibalanus amphitrite TaxID=1232801 RepID=UPI001C92A738|nr:uncharacterized protein LOC122391203 isoform X7 [Amphibalanus amphitrite]XP_043240826.1 uncharacterized protein LOC122391203 isoform X7 [Amphibalanus amphitrite]
MSDDEAASSSVSVYIYDLTAGLAQMFSQALLGQHVEGIWHTGVVAFGREYFFGSEGVQSCAPGGTILGEPTRVERIGETEVPYQLFLEYVFGLGESTFAPGKYNLIEHNCNNFADEVATFLCGHGIPKFILTLPDELLNTPLGQTVAPLLASLSLKRSPNDPLSVPVRDVRSSNREDSPDFVELNQRVEEIRKQNQLLDERRSSLSEKLHKAEKKKKKRDGKSHKKRRSRAGSADLLDVEESSSQPEEPRGPADGQCGASSSPELSSRPPPAPAPARSAPARSAAAMSDGTPPPPAETRPPAPGAEEPEPEKPRIPPVVFKDAVSDVKAEFDGLLKAVDGQLGDEELQNVKELKMYMLEDEGAWALGENFINFLGRILHDKSLPPAARVHLLNLLSVATTKDDFILILHQDRREHVIMNYADDVDRLPTEEQTALSLMFANMFDQNGSSEWLLYISEWQSPHNNMPISNIRVTTKVAVNALLADSAEMQDRGTAIMYNLAVKEVFDDVATELAMAILQYFQTSPPEERLYRCMRALAKFAQVSYNDVPQLIKMIGPEPGKFRGQSARTDELIAELETRLARVQM